jgi:glycosyltransferase involved in cell wall biosynthesis
MKVYYISPSTIPSRSANLIHVLFMCEALSNFGHEVTLFLHSHKYNSNKCIDEIKNSHDVNIDNDIFNIVAYKGGFKRGNELGIALYSLIIYLKDLLKGVAPVTIISRNLYGAFLLGILMRKSLIYETHTPEIGFRKYIQNSLLASKKIQTVVISNSLRQLILRNKLHLSERVHVLHDAARSGRIALDSDQRRILKKDLLSLIPNKKSFDKIIGYFGHLYPGRGIEVIQSLAKKHPEFVFVVYGGNDQEIEIFKNNNKTSNLLFMGHLNQSAVYEKMSMMDILLMPYQKQVSIGVDSVDTSKWMSPMKMFEYMSASVPIISSDLPVLREVLVHNENCILVQPDDIEAWSNALKNIFSSDFLYKKLSENSYNEYLNEYTWSNRSRKILDLSSKNNGI